jgi:hypothetical protein
MIVSLASDSLHGRPKSVVRLKVLSPVALETLPTYDGPTWLDRALAEKQLLSTTASGFGAELQKAMGDRRRWLAERSLAELDPSGKWAPKSGMAETLHAREHARIVQGLSRQLNASYLPNEPGSRISGVYDRAIDTPTGKLAVIRRDAKGRIRESDEVGRSLAVDRRTRAKTLARPLQGDQGDRPRKR